MTGVRINGIGRTVKKALIKVPSSLIVIRDPVNRVVRGIKTAR